MRSYYFGVRRLAPVNIDGGPYKRFVLLQTLNDIVGRSGKDNHEVFKEFKRALRDYPLKKNGVRFRKDLKNVLEHSYTCLSDLRILRFCMEIHKIDMDIVFYNWSNPLATSKEGYGTESYFMKPIYSTGPMNSMVKYPFFPFRALTLMEMVVMQYKYFLVGTDGEKNYWFYSHISKIIPNRSDIMEMASKTLSSIKIQGIFKENFVSLACVMDCSPQFIDYLMKKGKYLQRYSFTDLVARIRSKGTMKYFMEGRFNTHNLPVCFYSAEALFNHATQYLIPLDLILYMWEKIGNPSMDIITRERIITHLECKNKLVKRFAFMPACGNPYPVYRDYNYEFMFNRFLSNYMTIDMEYWSLYNHTQFWLLDEVAKHYIMINTRVCTSIRLPDDSLVVPESQLANMSSSLIEKLLWNGQLRLYDRCRPLNQYLCRSHYQRYKTFDRIRKNCNYYSSVADHIPKEPSYMHLIGLFMLFMNKKCKPYALLPENLLYDIQHRIIKNWKSFGNHFDGSRFISTFELGEMKSIYHEKEQKRLMLSVDNKYIIS